MEQKDMQEKERSPKNREQKCSKNQEVELGEEDWEGMVMGAEVHQTGRICCGNGTVCVTAMSGSQIWSFHTGHMYSYIILKHLIVAIIIYQLNILKHFMTLKYI